VLRRYLRERKTIDVEIGRNPATRHAAPVWLADRYRADWPVRWTQLLAAGDTQAPMWLRVNSRRSTAEDYLAMLRAAGIGARADARVPFAVALDAPRDVQALPGFSEGLVSVQDIGAQCVAFPLALAPGQRVLDACAAPGGKTALIAEREPNLTTLAAVDIDPQRLLRVRENLVRGNLYADVILNDAALPDAWWNGAPFDRILLDAPCSALGVIRRHPDIRLRKSPSEIDKLPMLQGRLLTAAWRMLATGGRLVYATCTVTRSENRDLVAAFLAGTPDAQIVPPETWHGWPGLEDGSGWGEADGFGRQILPGEAGADGFYYAALTKR
jgi:16S rRNA (cytosine967-C5)-methyltransferase